MRRSRAVYDETTVEHDYLSPNGMHLEQRGEVVDH